MNFSEWLLLRENENAFKQALKDNPTDWTTYLVFADWLEEHGQDTLALAYRWIGQKQKKPFHYAWYNEHLVPFKSSATLPLEVFRKLKYGYHLDTVEPNTLPTEVEGSPTADIPQHNYDSDEEAIADLIQALSS